MGIFNKIKQAFTKEPVETQNYEKGLAKTRKNFVSELNNLSKNTNLWVMNTLKN